MLSITTAGFQVYTAAYMPNDTDTPSILSQLQSDNRYLQREADSLRCFLTSIQKLIDAAHTRPRESQTLELLEQVLDNALRAINARDGSLLVPDDKSGELVFILVQGDEPHKELIGKRLPQGEGIAGWVAKNRRSTIVNNVSVDDRFYPNMDEVIEYKTKSIAAAPLIGGGRLLGVVEALNKRDGQLFTNGNQKLLSLMCRYAGELLYSVVRDGSLPQTQQKVETDS